MGGFNQWHLVVICIWCALFVTSQLDVRFMFANQLFREICWHNIHILLHALPQFMCHNCTEYKLSAIQVTISDEYKLKATTQQFMTAKISGCALKQESKTHSSLRQGNLQLQNQTSLMSCRILAVEHRKCATGLSNAHPSLQDIILPNYRSIENAHKVLKKIFDFLLCIEVHQIFSFPFFRLRNYQKPECFCVNNCCFWARVTVLPCYRNW